MAKFSLTVNTDNPSEISKILAVLGGNAPAQQPVSVPNLDDDDDENGPVNASAPAVDSTGLPWDERIHTPKKSTLKDGSWRKKKGVSDALVAQVEAELRARAAGPIPSMSAGQPAPFAPPAAPLAPAVQLSPSQAFGAVPNQAAPLAPTPAPMGGQPAPFTAPTQAQPAPTQPQQPAQTGPLDFATLMQQMQKAMQEGRCDHPTLGHIVNEINQAWGTNLTAITDLSTRPDMLPWVKDMLVNRGIWVD